MLKEGDQIRSDQSLSCVRLFATPWTKQPMEFSRPEYWSGYPFPSPGDLPNPGIEPRSPALEVDSASAEPQGKPCVFAMCISLYSLHRREVREDRQ